MSYQECCVAACKHFYIGFPEDGALMLKHVGILNVMCDFQSLYVHLLVTVVISVNRDWLQLAALCSQVPTCLSSSPCSTATQAGLFVPKGLCSTITSWQ